VPKLFCCYCKHPLKSSPVCPDCDQDNEVAFKNTNFDEQVVHTVMRSYGMAEHDGMGAIYLPIRDGAVPVTVSLAAPTPRQVRDLHQWIYRWCNFSPKMYTLPLATEYLNSVREGKLLLPHISYFTSRPLLLRSADGQKLYCPKIEKARDRMFEEEGVFYTGPAYEPNDTNWFDAWLDTFRYSTEDSRQALKQYILSALVQRLLPPGKMPMLVFSAEKPGAGKTTTAQMILAMFGDGILEFGWGKAKHKVNEIPRLLMDPRYAGLLLDNLTAQAPALLVACPELASLITKSELAVTRLYESIGTVTLDNYFLFIATANNPKLAPELFKRSVFCELDKEKPQCEEWEKTWLSPKRKALVIGSAMRMAIDNWAKGRYAASDPPDNYRFNDWYAVTARLVQDDPIIVPDVCSVIPSIDLALDTVWGYYGGGGEHMTLNQARDYLNSGAGPALKEFREQGDSSEREMIADIERFSREFKLFNHEGELCVLKKSNSSSLKQSVRL